MTSRAVRILSVLLASAVLLMPVLTHASGFGGGPATTGTFNLQVTPSPLVATVRPGAKTDLQVKIRNAGTMTENLRIDARAFKISDDSTNIDLLTTAPPDINNWLTIANPTFSVKPGQWYNENLTLQAPAAAGFSYSFALEISRQKVLDVPQAGSAISGSVAVFTLINVDRPGAKAALTVDAFTADHKMYEYLPATLSVRFHNTGNTISQPSGNIFIQRSSSSPKPLATLAVNPKQNYILPGTTRMITATWNDGFPHYVSAGGNSKAGSRKLVWNWTDLSHLRIGRYTAELVAVYSENGRDVPVRGSVSFWVVPWRILLVLLAVVLLVLFALFMIGRFIYKLARHGHARARQQPVKSAKTPKKEPEE